MTRANKDLPDRLAALIRGTSNRWVMEQQPADWKHSAWKEQWERYPLPCPHVLSELASEVQEHERIRRKFIFDAYRDRTPTELFIAVMAWGLGPSNYGTQVTTGTEVTPLTWLCRTFGGDFPLPKPRRMRWRRSSKPARPYICLLSIFVLQLTPSVRPL